MNRQRRLTRIESSLTPRQAVLLWLREEHQGQTSDAYLRSVMLRGEAAYPRVKLSRQVAHAIESAMKGRADREVSKAVRQARMEADFLVLLVNRTNWVILDNSRLHWTQIVLLQEVLRGAALAEDEEPVLKMWVSLWRSIASEVFAVQAACESIAERYFATQEILLADAKDTLIQQASRLEKMAQAFNDAAKTLDRADFVIDLTSFREGVRERGHGTAAYIVALAKSKMLDDFGESAASDAVIKPFMFADSPTQESSTTSFCEFGLADGR